MINATLADGTNEPADVITIKDLAMRYPTAKGPVTAIEDINLTVREGEFICVLGPSGCGKSTLLKIMAGFMKQTEGTALACGKPIEGPDWHRGVVFQTPALYPWLNIRDNVSFGPRMRKLPKDETDAAVAKTLDLVGLKDFGDHKPYELSGGMRQRASLARVLVSRPDLILMDEPFGALDAFTRINMQALIRSIWLEQHNTVFLITHDVDEALALATRVIVMSARPGRIVQSIDVDFTYDISGINTEAVRYSHEYVSVREECLDIINREQQAAQQVA